MPRAPKPFAMGKIPTKPPRSTAVSMNTSTNCMARTFPTTTSWTSPPPRTWSPSLPAINPRWPSSNTPTPAASARASNLRDAWDKAFATDRQAPFGGIIAVNQPLDLPCAEAIAEIFSEVIVAPDFAPDGARPLAKEEKPPPLKSSKTRSRPIPGTCASVGADSFLLQERDLKHTAGRRPEVCHPPPAQRPSELEAMLFGWRVVKHVKSNAIVYVAADRTLGIGAGQMSRVDASRLAVWKAGQAGLSLQGSVVCSDAFFPFADGLIAAAEAGATAAIQPGGSVRDPEVIAAADQRECRHGLHRHAAFQALGAVTK